MTIPKTSALANWFGSNRTLAHTVGPQLRGCRWVGVPFMGAGCELPYIECPGVANDLHSHVINLARVIRDPKKKAELAAMLDAAVFHPAELVEAQARCNTIEERRGSGLFSEALDEVAWARDYFICSWMGRGGSAGTDGEFNGALPIRYNANGGGSNVRFRSARESLDAWQPILARWEFDCRDAFEFIGKIRDLAGLGLYVDAPWPEAGDGYKHKFSVRDQRRLAETLGAYEKVRVVVRYGDHPLIRELYLEGKWTWLVQQSRDQGNKGVQEVLIINGPSYAGGA